MADEKKITHMPHNVTMNDCRNLTLTGVEEVIGCDEELLTLKSSMGEMTVGGRGMHIGSFNRGSGELKIDGHIPNRTQRDFSRGCLSDYGIHTLHNDLFNASGTRGGCCLGSVLRCVPITPQDDSFFRIFGFVTGYFFLAYIRRVYFFCLCQAQ